MIETAPCGCPTIPIDKFYKVKKHLLAGKMVWFDDPRCIEHEDGTGLQGCMIYQDGTTFCHMKEIDDEIVEYFPFDKAIDILSEFNKMEYEFAIGDASVEVEGNVINFVCGHSKNT